MTRSARHARTTASRAARSTAARAGARTILPLAHLRAANGGHGFRPALRYHGTDVRARTALAAAGHGLTLLPRSAATQVPGTVAVPVTQPRVVHRTELVYARALGGAVAAVAEAWGVRV